ncbi:hypothetical protein LOTGIDRAFT_168498 [Lottia gigantea]|uniref:Uncharacterized protein n=1 Tax=Lottia gigantea TaxID=225164 RepID=V3ZQ59_LOTGI|nr:hypothetical protein LOTGIDRAFT_168498 [Lottia gigantea]ESO84640.1 hypothetical protein LOTGIDRAFT_168498 [Lottia gigantea]
MVTEMSKSKNLLNSKSELSSEEKFEILVFDVLYNSAVAQPPLVPDKSQNVLVDKVTIQLTRSKEESRKITIQRIRSSGEVLKITIQRIRSSEESRKITIQRTRSRSEVPRVKFAFCVLQSLRLDLGSRRLKLKKAYAITSNNTIDHNMHNEFLRNINEFNRFDLG